MSEPKKYTGKDIERYHRGQMSAAEKHSLEKAALDDPMLADALEGYRLTSSPVADVDLLKHRLQQRVGKTGPGQVIGWKRHWLRIAALFVLFAGGGWLLFRTVFTHEADLAKRSSEGLPVETIKTDSPVTTENKNVPVFKTDTAALNDMAAVEKESAPAGSASVHKRKPASVPQSKVPVRETSREQAALISLRKAQQNRSDSLANLTAQREAAAAPQARVLNDTVRSLPAAKAKEEAALSEVVVSGYAKNRRQALVVAGDAIPTEGWPAFENYIEKNRKVPDDETAGEGKTEVVLTFLVAADGKPHQISVVESLCGSCDAEAIRLLKDGPRWKGKKGRVRIKIRP